MSRTLNFTRLKVAKDDLRGFWSILGHLGWFCNSADSACAVGYRASGQCGAKADAYSVQLLHPLDTHYLDAFPFFSQDQLPVSSETS